MSAIPQELTFKLRPMLAADVDDVFAIEQRAYPYPWTRNIFEDCLRVGYCCWVCCAGQKLVGYAIMSLAAGEGHVLNLCVDPQWQGRGIGRHLLSRLIRLAGERDTDTLFLEVRESNRPALRLYQALGFNEIHVRRGYYPADNGREDALVLARNLS